MNEYELVGFIGFIGFINQTTGGSHCDHPMASSVEDVPFPGEQWMFPPLHKSLYMQQ